ncbi:MAG: hypothetical protein JWO03_1441 [Bacteroidetes bacterium]|nr:hypothetical protein [Bacteroidota bacterium]
MHDYTRFTKRIAIKAPVNEIYNLWTTQEGLEKWLLRSAVFTSGDGHVRERTQPVQMGDTYAWTWFGWPEEVAEHGTITNTNGTRHFEFVFGKAGIVSIDIKEEHGETVLELVQESIPTDEESRWNYFIGCQTGWTFYLVNLKSILEGGLDLRNKSEALTNMTNS